ncbi:MAG TPA: FAD-dependent oxidoreductase, partial [Gammaproteobacteria bacterium]|nr:FAD-dependent oxidoreductase [Gammaproteobacteria bacterium]
MKIAIIGAGISGLVAAHKLKENHQVVLYEANDHIGGHTHTHEIHDGERTHPVDTGFIVFNDRTYPNFLSLLNELNVPYQKTKMGFSVNQQGSQFAYAGTSLNALFADRRNLFSWPFWRMLRDILRFNRHALVDLDEQQSFGDYLLRANYSQYFIERYILPMGAAIWSSDPQMILDMPMQFFVRFFHNHGLLTVTQQPQWYVIRQGSKSYVDALMAQYNQRVVTGTPVRTVYRESAKIQVLTEKYGKESFDKVIFACHSDQALRLLAHPTEEEQTTLGAIPYQENTAILHTDTSLLPQQTRAWAAWNYQLNDIQGATLTYNMNILQSLNSNKTYCVTLNQLDRINPEKVIKVIQYDHPVFNERSVSAQQRWSEISGKHHTHYCGAYWRWGFHEDGVVSALNVVRQIENGAKHAGLSDHI